MKRESSDTGGAASKIIQVRIHPDPRGKLAVIEGGSGVPFEIARVFYMFDVPAGGSRGSHANMRSRMVFTAIRGSCRIAVDDGESRTEYSLDNPETALWCDRMTWKELYDFTGDCLLLALCDTHYDAGEYLTDYEKFRDLKRSQGKGKAK